MTNDEILRLKAWATLYDALDLFVILKEDENYGRYIEYAFKDGCPLDNRCLSWYDKLQPEAFSRNGHDPESWKLHETGKIYELQMLSCGNENKTGDEHCSPGHPNRKCVSNGCAKHWTYDEPVKCACWILNNVNPEHYKINLKDSGEFEKIYKELCQEQTETP